MRQLNSYLNKMWPSKGSFDLFIIFTLEETLPQEIATLSIHRFQTEYYGCRIVTTENFKGFGPHSNLFLKFILS